MINVVKMKIKMFIVLVLYSYLCSVENTKTTEKYNTRFWKCYYCSINIKKYTSYVTVFVHNPERTKFENGAFVKKKKE